MNTCQCCGAAQVHVYDDGFTRGLCDNCDTSRCDLEDGCAYRPQMLPYWDERNWI